MRFSVLAAVLSLFLAANVRGQVKPSQVDDIRRQMDALQKQLNILETAQTTPTQKVTQLGASRHQRGEPTLIVRVYDLSDLFSIAPAYAAVIGNEMGLQPRLIFPEAAVAPSAPGSTGTGNMGGMGGMGGGLFNVRNEPVLAQAASGRSTSGQPTNADVAASAKTSIQSLSNAITSTIDPETWEEMSGPGTIARIGTSLIIRNEAGVHEQIDALFTLLRQKWGTLRTVSISAWWLPLTEQQLAKVLPANGKGKTGVEGIEAFGVVDDAAWRQLAAADLGADRQVIGTYRTVITCYNGQTVHATSGAEEGIINQIVPILAQTTDNKNEGRAAYQPVVTPIQEGTSLQVTPLVNASGRFVMLDIHSRICVREPVMAAKRPAPHEDEGPAAVVAALDRPRLLTQRLAMTLRAPVDRVMLVGGMTLSTKPQRDEPTLYLFLRATVQELREDVKKSAPIEPAQGEEKEGPA